MNNSKPEGSVIRVSDVMHNNYCLLNGLATVADALTQMREQQARALIIDKRDADDEYGVVTLSDLSRKVLAPNRAPERVNLYEIMSKPAVGVPPSMQIRFCARLFERFGLTVAPVIDEGRICGVVDLHALVVNGLERSLAQG